MVALPLTIVKQRPEGEMHADQPAEGRFDGEDSNFGMVTIEDNVYAELTDTMTRVNAAAEQIHAQAAG